MPEPPAVRAARPARSAPAPPADPAFAVRRATSADLDHVLALRLALLREHGGNPVYGRLHREAPSRARTLFRDQLASAAEVTWLAVRPDDDAPVGILRCMEGRGSPLLDPPRYGYVASVYVVPDARRAGVMRALLAEAEAWSRERGLDELRLHAASDNAGGVAAWRAMGFAVAEHLLVRPLEPAPARRRR
ncbi:GNAT family N-acetyltransferase [Roseisolibacter sp. H3M3-2]|uniref:GNAT family N-acetyltransferase n=1 Tax=Roseisolibacter sp. H3M3-2 TaxID=3031323 RepID=UPI0023DA0475|nr:GNAT family N-acetyltransferase [Roseisolibacter sp. H3M3-2]MDF1504473.1 GNAT family N-acetyltransferase [Roseisolibacter sp. H3M3-2]